jgi:hypothetical protein
MEAAVILMQIDTGCIVSVVKCVIISVLFLYFLAVCCVISIPIQKDETFI